MKELNRLCIPRRNGNVDVPCKQTKGIEQEKANSRALTQGIGLGVNILCLSGKEMARKKGKELVISLYFYIWGLECWNMTLPSTVDKIEK